MANKKIVYAEPAEYIPEYIRKELEAQGYGKFTKTKTETKKAPAKKAGTKAGTKKK